MNRLKSFYAKYVFGPLMDWSLRRPMIDELRERLIPQAAGDVLELGYGTGLNLPHYSRQVRRLTLIDPVEIMPRRVAQRIADCRAGAIERIAAAAEGLPIAEASIDCVVSTFTLCSVEDVAAALAEVCRVLKPGGRLLLLEHGRSEDSSVARWQDRLNGLQRLVACGCNLNRPIQRVVESAGLAFTSLDRLTLPEVPRVMGSMYLGTAAK
jgi:ubiquinone/menaquinone biosynthesis C-methylase UbiE